MSVTISDVNIYSFTMIFRKEGSNLNAIFPEAKAYDLSIQAKRKKELRQAALKELKEKQAYIEQRKLWVYYFFIHSNVPLLDAALHKETVGVQGCIQSQFWMKSNLKKNDHLGEKSKSVPQAVVKAVEPAEGSRAG